MMNNTNKDPVVTNAKILFEKEKNSKSKLAILLDLANATEDFSYIPENAIKSWWACHHTDMNAEIEVLRKLLATPLGKEMAKRSPIEEIVSYQYIALLSEAKIEIKDGKAGFKNAIDNAMKFYEFSKTYEDYNNRYQDCRNLVRFYLSNKDVVDALKDKDYAQSIWKQVIAVGDAETLKLLVDNGLSLELIADKEVNRVLAQSIKYDNKDLFKYLAQYKKLDFKDKNLKIEGQNPLLSAIEQKAFNITKYLIAEGADLTVRTNDCYSRNVLFQALKSEEPNIVRLLLEKEPVKDLVNQENDAFKQTPALYAALRCPVEVVDLLYCNGANIFKKDCMGETILHCAAKNEKYGGEVIEFLLEQDGVKEKLLNAESRNGALPFLQAGVTDNINAVKALVYAGCKLPSSDVALIKHDTVKDFLKDYRSIPNTISRTVNTVADALKGFAKTMYLKTQMVLQAEAAIKPLSTEEMKKLDQRISNQVADLDTEEQYQLYTWQQESIHSA